MQKGGNSNLLEAMKHRKLIREAKDNKGKYVTGRAKNKKEIFIHLLLLLLF